MAWSKVAFCTVFSKFIPRADELAIIAAKDTVAHCFTILYWYRSFILYGEIRNTFSSIKLVGSYDSFSRADVDTRCAAATVCSGALIGG